MKDSFGRDIYYLRMSVTDRCNLRCVYCMPENCEENMSEKEILSVDEIAQIVSCAAACGITKVRLTGGEPLVRKDILEICRRVSDTPGICELCLTTNGILLPQFIDKLQDAGVTRLNISLDSLDPVTYKKITRTGTLDAALRGIYAALEAGFLAVKINAVLMGGVNDNEIRELLELTRKFNANVRFIEMMPIGETADWAETRFVSVSRVLELAPELKEIGSEGVAQLYMLPNGIGTVGLISPISSHFCPTCNRIRVASDGKLKPCLHSSDEIDLRGLLGKALEDTIKRAIFEKPRKHTLDDGEISHSLKNMNQIGG
ncbi:MAG: GTP 3',8-cyclase MoaA [Oscillospiraceae bacterium]|nr:GTP 3',8-cyclase MoaA [Oscillospiraceae bacterium]